MQEIADPTGMLIALALIIWSVRRMQTPGALLFALLLVLLVLCNRIFGIVGGV